MANKPNILFRLTAGRPLTPGELDDNFRKLRDYGGSLEDRISALVSATGALQANIVTTAAINDLAVTEPKLAAQSVSARTVINKGSVGTPVGKGLKKAANDDPVDTHVDASTIDNDASNGYRLYVPGGGITQVQTAGKGVSAGFYACFTESKSADAAPDTTDATGSGTTEKTRVLNTTVENNISGASLNTGTGVMTLPAGKYRFKAVSALKYSDQDVKHRLAIHNGTTYPATALGLVQIASGNAALTNRSTKAEAVGTFELSGSASVSLRHIVLPSASATISFGIKVNMASLAEVYAALELWYAPTAF